MKQKATKNFTLFINIHPLATLLDTPGNQMQSSTAALA